MERRTGSELTSTAVRGSLLIPIINYVKTQRTPSEWSKFLEDVGTDARHVFIGSLVPMSWYPFSLALSALDAIVLIRDKDDIVQKVSYYALDFATNMIFRAIFRLGSPEFFMRRADQVWRRFYNRGHMLAPDVRTQYARIELHDFPEITPNYNRAVTHSMGAVLIKAGARNVKVLQTKDIVRADEFSEYHFTWD